MQKYSFFKIVFVFMFKMFFLFAYIIELFQKLMRRKSNSQHSTHLNCHILFLKIFLQMVRKYKNNFCAF